jgi:hypothetical protein
MRLLGGPLTRRCYVVWFVEMARIVHYVCLIPCDYGVRSVCNPTCHLGGGFSYGGSRSSPTLTSRTAAEGYVSLE